MATLNSWQLITRVLAGRPFGDGRDGAYSSSTIPSLANLRCSGTVDSTTLTVSSTTLANNDVVVIHQTRGTGAGQWEINEVASGGGTTSLTMRKPLHYTYSLAADNGNEKAQVIKMPLYTNVTAAAGTWTVPAWQSDKLAGTYVGGMLWFACNGTFTPTATITALGKGFDGGKDGAQNSVNAEQGESYPRDGYRAVTANSGGGGSEAAYDQGNGYGCGGGYGTAGEGTQPGQTYGASALTSIHLGSGGGGNMTVGGGDAVEGGAGGGIIGIYAKTMTAPTSISVKGAEDEYSGSKEYDGGGGSGGSILICGYDVDIGTSKLDARGSTSMARDGGKGRVAVYYGANLTGSLSSTYYGSYDNASDSNLVETGGSFLFNLI